MDKQPRVTDFIPRRYRVYALLGTVGLLVIAGLEALYAAVPDAQWLTIGGQPQAFDLGVRGSLAAWFGSTLLLASGLVAGLVFSLRRFKIDDYKGRYRVWFWVALACFALSIDETAGLRHGYQAMLVKLTGHNLLGDGTLWWYGTLALGLALVGIRLVLDTRACRGSTSLILLAAILWTVAATVGLHWISIGHVEDVMIGAGCNMVGHLALVMGLTLHARYVILDIEGLLPRRASEPEKQKPKRVRAPKADAAGSITRVDAPHKSRGSDKRTDLETPATAKASKEPAQSASKPHAAAAESDEDLDEGDDDFGLEPSGGNRKSSRADRKRLRKLQRQQREGQR